MLAAITITATFVSEHELGPLLGVVGALFGSAVVYIIPAIWNLKVADQMPFFRGEKAANVILGLAGERVDMDMGVVASSENQL